MITTISAQGKISSKLLTHFFNQILSLTILWYICKFAYDYKNNTVSRKMIFCLDNLDVLVNKEIIENFFKEYFLFVRNIDSIIQNLDDEYAKRESVTYNSLFVFVLSCRQHTWARVKEDYSNFEDFKTKIDIVRTRMDIAVGAYCLLPIPPRNHRQTKHNHQWEQSGNEKGRPRACLENWRAADGLFVF